MRRVLSALLDSTLLASLVVLSCVAMARTSTSKEMAMVGGRPYNPWADVNNDGKIDIFDVVTVTSAYGVTGDPLPKTLAAFNSGWINITGKAGQDITITHNLNTTNVIVDLIGKTTPEGGPHQKSLGLTAYKPGWACTYGGTPDVAFSLTQTQDGGYAMAGYTVGPDMDNDFRLVKTNGDGVVQWSRTYEGQYGDWAYAVIETMDNGFAIVGYTSVDASGVQNGWLVKTDADGVRQWDHRYEGLGAGVFKSVIQLWDEGFAIAGYTSTAPFDEHDMWLVRTDEFGNLVWETFCGGPDHDEANALVHTGDENFVMAGWTDSYGTGRDAILAVVNADGEWQWSSNYGGSSWDEFTDIVLGPDGYAMSGFTYSSGYGSSDVWLLTTDYDGTVVQSHTYGRSIWDQAYSIWPTDQGGYALGGFTCDPVSGNEDFWVVVTAANGATVHAYTYGYPGNEEAFSMVGTPDGGYALAGWTLSFAGGYRMLLIVTETQSGVGWVGASPNNVVIHCGVADQDWLYVLVIVQVFHE